MRMIKSMAAALTAVVGTGAAAQDMSNLEVVGVPTPGGMGFQPAVTELALDIQWLDSFLLIVIAGISVFVTALIIWCAIRYNQKRNPNPSSFTHNSPLEVAWTITPVVILVMTGAFSLPILFKQQVMPDADVTIKVTGYQWYWGYEYVDDGFMFDSYMIGAGENKLTPDVEAELVEAGYSKDEFLLATDNAMVVPVGKNVVLQLTGADVIHAWTIPAFGVKQDAVPGRLAELWFNADKEGVYFGQCSELCGQAHSYMPITVKVVSEDAYNEWLASAAAEYAGIASPDAPVLVASN